MQAAQFEYRHQTLVSQLLIGAAVLTYLLDRVDVVWRFIQPYPNRRQLEHACFLIAALLIGAAAAVCSRARLRDSEVDARTTILYRIGEVFYAIGLGALLPVAGFVFLLAGQSLRVLRLKERIDEENSSQTMGWTLAIRKEAAKWGLMLTMFVFSLTLVDRQADVLAGASYATWAALNLPWGESYTKLRSWAGEMVRVCGR